MIAAVSLIDDPPPGTTTLSQDAPAELPRHMCLQSDIDWICPCDLSCDLQALKVTSTRISFDQSVAASAFP